MLHHILRELGLASLYHSPHDTKLLCAQRFVRLFAYGGSTLILASYLSALRIPDDRIGLFMTLTLVGDVVISFLLTLFADRMGRKAVLMLGSGLMCVSGVVFGTCANYWALLAAAIFGVISPNGNEIGPFRAVEESTIAHITPKEHMSDIFAWYSLIGTAGTSLGMMVCGWLMSILQETQKWEFVAACRVVFLLYAAVGMIKLLLTMGLSASVEADSKKKNQQQQDGNGARETDPLLASNAGADNNIDQVEEDAAPATKHRIPFLPGVEPQFIGLVTSLFFFFALDSFGSALASLSWVTYYFRRKFGMSDGELGSLFSGASIIQAASMLTMVFTHLPSCIFLALMPLPSSFPIAMTFLLGRACMQNMDVAPRAAFLASALPAEQRTAIMGTINVVKTTSSSLAPVLTGVLSSRGALWVAFVAAGCLKIVYDIGMLVTFGGMDSEQKKQRDAAAAGDEEGQGQ